MMFSDVLAQLFSNRAIDLRLGRVPEDPEHDLTGFAVASANVDDDFDIVASAGADRHSDDIQLR
jgi:hypothetical protein